jgi:hypothetical protein
LRGDVATAVWQWCLGTVPWLLRFDPRGYAGPLRKALWVLEQLPQTEEKALGRLAGLIRARAQQVAQAIRPR